MNKFDLLKSHIDAYTRNNGTFVSAHDDKRASAKKQFKRAHGVARLMNRREEGWDPEDGPVVNVRGDGNLKRIEYDDNPPDYKANMAAERATSRIKDKLPSHPGTVIDAKKQKDAENIFGNLFGEKPDAKTFYDNARSVPAWFNKKSASLEEIESGLSAMTNSGLRFMAEGLSMDAVYQDPAMSDKYEGLARKMRAEIKRRYLSEPGVLKKSDQ